MRHTKAEVRIREKINFDCKIFQQHSIPFFSEEIFYQILIFDFGNFGKIMYDPPLPIRELAILALKSVESEWTPEDGPIEDLADNVVRILTEWSGLLKDYYSLTIEDGKLCSLPLLIG